MDARKFRKKPVVIEAFQWFEPMGEVGPVKFYDPNLHPKRAANLQAFELRRKVNFDLPDWIITGIKGEHYPCKPDIFEQTYELVE